MTSAARLPSRGIRLASTSGLAPADPRDTLPPGAQDGQGVIVPNWSRMNFSMPPGGVITLIADQESQSVFQATSDTLPVWSPPYPSGSAYLSYDEILALPSADPFFGELFQALDAKLAAQTAAPAESPP